MTSFAEHADDYLRLRRSFGFKLHDHERLLRRFAAHLDDLGADAVTIELSLAWATERDVPAGSVVPAMRLLVVRGFARYMIGLDPRTEIPPTELIPLRQHRRAPFIYSDADIAALMEQARTRIRQPVVAATYETLIGLLAATGMRISEAIKLDRADIDWTDGVLLVRESKFNKSRYLPVHHSTLQALERYAGVRDRLCRNPSAPSFFVSLRRARLDDCAAQATFRRLCRQTGVGADAPFPPRLHDLRHTLAVRTLLGWYREGVDVQARLPVLATYLGHLNPVYTYYYLSAAPELLAHAAGMRDAYWETTS
ncbi:MAG: tyrosine-type recombinase/integrase [Solirubrobacteraceae bacterium]